MDLANRVRDYLLDNIGHMTFPGNASFNAATGRWFVPICCRTAASASGWYRDVELDNYGHIVFALASREETPVRLCATVDDRDVVGSASTSPNNATGSLLSVHNPFHRLEELCR